jgi:hypothetical protein
MGHVVEVLRTADNLVIAVRRQLALTYAVAAVAVPDTIIAFQSAARRSLGEVD